MEDDDYWATITFDKPKFPWQHDQDGERQDADLAGDPLHAQGQGQGQPPVPEQHVEQPNLTQPVSLGADGSILNGMGTPGLGAPSGTGPQQMPGGFQGGPPFGGDPGSTANDPIPADFGMQGGTGPQAPFGVPGQPDQPVYGQEPQHAYGAAEQPSYGGQEPSYGAPEPTYSVPEQPPYGGEQPSYGVPGDQPSYGGQEQPSYGGDQSPFSVPDQPQYGSPEPSYGDYGSDPLGTRPAAAAGPPVGGRPDAFPQNDPRVSDPLGLSLNRPPEDPIRGYGDSSGGLPLPSEPA
ncbi:hypothetical protein E1298_47265, partial [Actinomadura rubrisoli]